MNNWHPIAENSVTEPSPPVRSAVELRGLIDEGAIQTLFQPVVRMNDRAPVSLEILARLDHPVLGTLDAHDFVPILERAGQGAPLFDAVLARAIDELFAHGLDRLALDIAINIPLDVLLQSTTAQRLDVTTAARGLAPERVIIELTESQELTALPDLARAVQGLRGAGYRLAIDDVGIDIRDHSPLLDLPFSFMKLDRGLVGGARRDPSHGAYLDLVAATARESGMTIVAEGIEDPATWEDLHARGIDQAQGYYVSRPLPAHAVAAWYTAWSAG